MKTYLSSLPFFVACAIALQPGCGTLEADAVAAASNPNTVHAVGILVSQAGDLLSQAIGQAESYVLKSLATDPNGNLVQLDVAKELKSIKAQLDALPLTAQELP